MTDEITPGKTSGPRTSRVLTGGKIITQKKKIKATIVVIKIIIVLVILTSVLEPVRTLPLVYNLVVLANLTAMKRSGGLWT